MRSHTLCAPGKHICQSQMRIWMGNEVRTLAQLEVDGDVDEVLRQGRELWRKSAPVPRAIGGMKAYKDQADA